MTLLVSPAEPPELRAIGTSSIITEEFGADFLWSARDGLVAVQRKTIADLLASLDDGRLAREIPLLHSQEVAHALLLVEGRPTWTDQGLLMNGGRARFGRHGWFGLMLSLQMEHGIALLSTDDMRDTIAWLRYAPGWFDKPEHRGLIARPRPTDQWGDMAPRDFGIHLLQSFPGIGAGVAAAIYDHFGRVPMSLDVDERTLRQVGGVGEKRAATIARMLGGTNAHGQDPAGPVAGQPTGQPAGSSPDSSPGPRKRAGHPGGPAKTPRPQGPRRQ